MLQGRLDEGLAWVGEARDHASLIKHLHSFVFARHFLQLAHYWRDEPTEVLVECEGFAALCREQGFTYWLTVGAMIEGWAHVRLGRPQGFELLEKGLGGWLRTGARLAATQHFGFLADALLVLNRHADGLSAISKAEAAGSETGERCYVSHVADLKGLLLLDSASGNNRKAETAFAEAIAVASSIGAQWLELRAAVHLAQLLEMERRANEIPDLIHPRLQRISGASQTTIVGEALRLLQAASAID